MSLAAGALNAVLTVTDGDLDVATATVDLGNVVRFEDDAPTAALALQGGVTVVVDESLGQNGAPETEGGASGLGRVTVLGTTLFTSTATTGQDNEGATTVFSLSIVGAGATGLFSTDNQAITLFNAGGGLIQGRYGAANTVAFTLTIDATTGDVTLTQLEVAASSDRRARLAGRVCVACGRCAECGSDGDGRRPRRCDGDGGPWQRHPVRGRRADGCACASGWRDGRCRREPWPERCSGDGRRRIRAWPGDGSGCDAVHQHGDHGPGQRRCDDGVLAVDCRRRRDGAVLDGQPGDHAVRAAVA